MSSTKSYSNSYKEAGVDVTAGYRSVELIKKHVARTNIPGVVSGIGGFGGLFEPDFAGMKTPTLVSGTDGVGTKMTGIDTRATILGHVQRGGSPTVRDRVLATQMGYHAVELLEQGIGNRVVGIKQDKVVDYDIDQALEMHKDFEFDLYKIADVVSI